jgi:myo-inositol-1(or 4)-monophosphatase
MARITDRQLNEREVKLAADAALDRIVAGALSGTDIPIVSEEDVASHSTDPSGTAWIVDPLDGSYNFARNLGPSMISVALWRAGAPVFGVLHDVDAGRTWGGGPGIPSRGEQGPIFVSTEDSMPRCVVCTGFPSRFPVGDDRAVQDYVRSIASFGKVRMLGSAAASLLRVARGSAEVYFERHIMLWDVAAGLAIVAGAGGSWTAEPLAFDRGCTVVATNGRVTFGAP